jgi:chemotaxis signal transduction protein
MSRDARTASDRLAEMRRAFDLSFTRTPPARDDAVDLLAITVGADLLAVNLSDVAGLVADRAVTPLPGAPPALMGVAGLRGHLIPVYDLATVLGARGREPTARPRWMILVAGSPALAVAVDGVDAHLRVSRDVIAAPVSTDGVHGRHAAAMAHTTAGPRPLLDMVAVRATIVNWNRGATSHAASHHL